MNAFGQEGFINPTNNEIMTNETFASMTYSEMEVYADTIYSEIFANITQAHAWTKDEINGVNTMVTSRHTDVFSEYARKLMVSK